MIQILWIQVTTVHNCIKLSLALFQQPFEQVLAIYVVLCCQTCASVFPVQQAVSIVLAVVIRFSSSSHLFYEFASTLVVNFCLP